MAVPSGVIFIWAGSNASIPAGWVRETALDDKYPKGHGAENPNVAGGNNVHSHSGSHSHSLVGHNHTYVTGLSNEWTAGDYSGGNPDGGENNICAKHDHGSGTTSGISGGSLQSATVTWGSVNHEPPYHKVIFIKPSATVAPIKTGIIAHYNGALAPLGYNFCDGNNSTPDLRDRYLKGASAGADAGSPSGATSHQHTVTHGHTANPHSHSGNTPNNGNPYGARQSQAPDSGHATTAHQHAVTLNNATDTVANFVKTDAGASDVVEPAYKKVGLVQCSTPSLKLGLVAMWLGSVASVPKNWAVCDGSNGTIDMRDRFIKVPTTLAGNGAIGGSNTHTHSPISHTHSPTGSHSHTGSTGGSLQNRERRAANSGAGIVLGYDTHPISSVSSVSPTYSSDNLPADTVDNQPPYRTVAYIQLNKLDPAGASLLHNFL